METTTSAPLSEHTTMRIGGNATYFARVTSIDDVRAAQALAHEHHIPTYILGGGSNTIATDAGFEGVVVHNEIAGFDVQSEDDFTTTIRVGGGEDWDETVKRTVEMNLSGIEALSAIPGTVGASPVQNIGAYGQEVSDVISAVEAYDTATDSVVTLDPDECQFSYRHSIFRGEAYERYIITAVTMRLRKSHLEPPFYRALQDYMDQHGVKDYSPAAIREAVMAIRFAKLPDPAKLPNSGSFFKNALIETWLYDELVREFPDMPSYAMPDGRYKIPTGWLIEQCGFRGQDIGGIHVHEGNALVLINKSAQSYHELETARDTIISAVRDKFRITIEQEPLMLGTVTA